MAGLTVEMWPIERCIPYCRNPRKNDEQVDRMASAIREFGFRIPIVAKSDGSVVDGHLRLKAAQKLGLKEVPVALADELTDAQVKAFRILANKSANWAEWEPDMLKLELQELQELDFDLELTGFELPEIDEIIGGGMQDETSGLTDPDTTPALPETPVTREGDVWVLGRHRLMCGSCTDAGAVAVLMNGKKADAIATDPPYGLGNSQTEKNNYDSYEDTPENLEELIAGFMPIAQSLAPVIVLTPGNKNQWLYPRPTWCMAWFCPAGVGMSPWGFVCWQPILCYGKDPKLAHGKGSHPDALVHQEAPSADWHPCAKPLKFWEWLVERVSEEGALLYEPFSGSGTTIMACEELNRSCYAMELSPRYVDCAVNRWQDFTGEVATLESGGLTFEAVKEKRVG
jgi:DNA modification methylase